MRYRGILHEVTHGICISSLPFSMVTRKKNDMYTVILLKQKPPTVLRTPRAAIRAVNLLRLLPFHINTI